MIELLLNGGNIVSKNQNNLPQTRILYGNGNKTNNIYFRWRILIFFLHFIDWYVIELFVSSRHRREINCIIQIFRSIQCPISQYKDAMQTLYCIHFACNETVVVQLVLSIFVPIPLSFVFKLPTNSIHQLIVKTNKNLFQREGSMEFWIYVFKWVNE